MRLSFLCFFAAAFLAACGSGYSMEEEAALQGLVYEADGQTGDRSGITLVLVETGATATTDADGGFSFGALPDGTYTVEVAGARLAAQSEGDLDEDEDGMGRPVIEINRSNGRVEIHLAILDGQVIEWSFAHFRSQRAGSRLEPTPEAEEAGLTAKVCIKSRDDSERFKVCVEGLASGDVIDVLLSAPSETPTFASAGTATADEEGEACFIRDTKQGDTLPEGATSVADLVGYLLQVKLGETLLFEGEVPPLPEAPSGEPGRPGSNGRAAGRALLDAAVEGVEGHVHLCISPGSETSKLKIDVSGLTQGDEVSFQIEDAENAGEFLDLGTETANASGRAKFYTRDAGDVAGLAVQVLLGGEVILTGTVPELVDF